MAALTPLATVLLLSAGGASHAQAISDWHAYVTQASLRFGIPAHWIERVIRTESDGQTMRGGQPIRSRAGAMGLMQLMPGTWQMMRRTLGLGTNPDEPRDNILAGTLYLRMLYDRFGYPGLFAAYNVGPSRYAVHLTTGRALPAETIAYLGKVGTPNLASSAQAVSQAVSTTETLFAIRDGGSNPPAGASPTHPAASLFAVENDGP